jgi:hypothetical protein
VNPFKLLAMPVRAVLSVLDAVGELQAALRYAKWQLDALDAQLEYEADQDKELRPPGSDGSREAAGCRGGAGSLNGR